MAVGALTSTPLQRPETGTLKEGSQMKLTISVIKADIGSIGGHICPSQRLMDTVDAYVSEHGAKLLLDSYISYTGDDIAIVSTHEQGVNDAEVHKLCWDAFMAGTAAAKSQGLYGAGQEAFSGNVRGMGPAVAFRHRSLPPMSLMRVALTMDSAIGFAN
jgi:fructose 1,6-bisphosphatase